MYSRSVWWKSVKKRRKSGVAGEFLSGIVDAALGRDAVLVAAVLFISVLAATKNSANSIMALSRIIK